MQWNHFYNPTPLSFPILEVKPPKILGKVERPIERVGPCPLHLV